MQGIQILIGSQCNALPRLFIERNHKNITASPPVCLEKSYLTHVITNKDTYLIFHCKGLRLVVLGFLVVVALGVIPQQAQPPFSFQATFT